MPYFMDFHIFDQVTVEEVKQAHVADRSVQNRYGVKYLQFWVNVDMGTVFCLMEGPNAEACAKVHHEAHGNVACNITEVQRGFYEQFMGEAPLLDHGLVLKQNGRVDTGLRYLMVVDLVNLTQVSHPGEYRKLLNPLRPQAIVCNTIREFKGKEIKNQWDNSILAVFDEEDFALLCAMEIQKLLGDISESVRYKIALATGQPVSERQGFFEESLAECQRLNVVAQEGEVLLDTRIGVPQKMKERMALKPGIRQLTKSQSSFAQTFFELVTRHLNDSNFSVNFMTSQLGISRPQLYRKITDLTGRSPNQFLRDIRLRKALALIRENKYNVSEIAYEVGFGNPSYFTKRFQEKYGISPSKVAG